MSKNDLWYAGFTGVSQEDLRLYPLNDAERFCDLSKQIRSL
jgi:hypothetical protein